MTLRGKKTFFGSNLRVEIEGKHYSPQSFVKMAKDRGIEISVQSVSARIRCGITTMEGLLAPPTSRQSASRSTHSRKKAEMAETLARMGPPRRY